MYKYLFGPIPSRRLGMSLGVDLVPKKVCSINCVYCEVGRTTNLTLDRKEYVKIQTLKDELIHYFGNNPDPDYITLTGSGEPTLNSRIDDLIQFLKQTKPTIPIAILTSGTLLYDKEVRDDIKDVDLILPSLDAATDYVFKKINRPKSDLTIEKYIQGLIELRKEFKGTIWLEVFILPGYNDTPEELNELKKVIEKIKPEAIQLNTLDRPGAMPNLRGASRQELQRIKELWAMDNVIIIAKSPERKNIPSYQNDIETTILNTISRRPCTIDDLTEVLGLKGHEIYKYLDVLEVDQRIETEKLDRGVFYQMKDK